jgi:uncharacterized protein (UPF0333 family)
MIFIKNKRGQIALFITLTTMFLLLFVGLFVTNIVLKQTKVAGNVFKSSQAYYWADTGAERALDEIRSSGTLGGQSLGLGTSVSEDVNLDGSNDYEIIVTDNTSPNPNLVVKVRGFSSKVARSVELSWDDYGF